MTAKIIVICGHEGSGKSTTARFIASALNRRGYTTKIISFASPLKELVNIHMNINKSDATGRNKLEEFGMDIRRLLGNDVFTNATFAEMRNGNYDYYIIDDLRYIHELISLHESEYLTYILKTRDIINPRSMDDTRLDELTTYMETNNVNVITLPDAYDEVYRFIEKFIELVR